MSLLLDALRCKAERGETTFTFTLPRATSPTSSTLSHVTPRSLSRVCSLFLYSGFPESFFFSAVLFTVVSLVDASPIQL